MDGASTWTITPELAEALHKAQSSMESVHTDSRNTHFGARYASLAAVRAAVLPKFHDAGISVVQEPVSEIRDSPVHESGLDTVHSILASLTPGDDIGGDAGRVIRDLLSHLRRSYTYLGIVTHLIHKSGAKLSLGPVFSPLAKEDPQGVGSSTTYLRRYCLLAIAGLAPDDDDGNQASHAPARQDYQEHSSTTHEQKPAAGGDPMEIVQSGKHQGKPWKEAPGGFIRWVLETLSPESTMYKGADNQAHARGMYDGHGNLMEGSAPNE